MEIYFFQFFLLKWRILNIIYKTNRAREKADQLGTSEPEEWQLTPESKLPELSFASHTPGVEMKQQHYRKAHKHRSQKPPNHDLLHVDIISKSHGSFFIYYLKVIEGLSERQGTKWKASSVGAVNRDRKLKSAHVLYVLNINALRILLTSLIFQAHMDLSLLFISQSSIVLCSVVVFQVQSSY